jgi:NTP pyrophosphatase (non-canonical NTP hydrolase)
MEIKKYDYKVLDKTDTHITLTTYYMGRVKIDACSVPNNENFIVFGHQYTLPQIMRDILLGSKRKAEAVCEIADKYYQKTKPAPSVTNDTQADYKKQVFEGKTFDEHISENELFFEVLQENVLNWANERNLLKEENATKQFCKVVEELGELSSALLKGNELALKDAFGDVLVTLIILSKQKGLDLLACLNLAYNEIKDRKGQTINGTFIKE